MDVNTTDLDSLISSISNQDYQFAFDCLNSDTSISATLKNNKKRRIRKLSSQSASSINTDPSFSNGFNITNQNNQDIDIDEQVSAEFARADDDYHVKSSDEDFSYSYGDLLTQKESTTIGLNNAGLIINKTEDSQCKVQEIIDLIIHRLPGD